MLSIPGGTLQMGTPEWVMDWLQQEGHYFPRQWFADETPQIEVRLAPFQIDRYPVTVAQFRDFVHCTGYVTDAERNGYGMVYSSEFWDEMRGACWHSPGGPMTSAEGYNDHPVVHMSWNDATSYAEWSEKRLPTEAEWEMAARGQNFRLWPWGDEWNEANCNTAEFHTGKLASLEQWLQWWKSVYSVQGAMPQTMPIGSFPSGDSAFGCSDMAGNVYEWTQSLSTMYDERVECDPVIRASMGRYRVIRGGSWMNFRYQVRCSERMHGDPNGWSNFALGFRCAKDA
jgi:sulfatase modifying factor 1